MGRKYFQIICLIKTLMTKICEELLEFSIRMKNILNLKKQATDSQIHFTKTYGWQIGHEKMLKII